ncbi:MAG: hypothetical protein PHF37_03185 [Phycisphaerae bacterium]|nr:hypothetical protein [Phycisphaerae bacterium]
MKTHIYLFDEKESGCGFYYKAQSKKQAELAYFADFNRSPQSCRTIQTAVHLSPDIIRDAQKAINECLCF